MNRLTRIKNAMNQMSAGGFAMKRRLRFYLFSLIAALMALVLVLLSLLGVFTSVNDYVADMLHANVNTYSHDVASHYRSVAAQGVGLAERLSAKLEDFFDERELTPADLNDSVELTTQAELAVFDILESALLMTDANGAFFMLNSTVNTALETAETSRSCLYLKLANVNVSKPVNPEILMFRGAVPVAKQRDVVFHNQWDLEYDLTDLAGYGFPLYAKEPEPLPVYYYTESLPVRGTWEEAMYLIVPVMSKNETLYGVCGFEISAIYYKLAHGMAGSRLSHVAGITARRDGDTLYPGSGLESGMSDGWFGNVGAAPLTVEEGALNRYSNESGEVYYGVEREISIGTAINASGVGGRWVSVAMIPEADYNSKRNAKTGSIALFCALFLAVAVGFCLFLSRKYVDPILVGLEKAKQPGGEGKTGILEIDDLLQFLSSQEEQHEERGGGEKDAQTTRQSPNLQGFEAFVRNIATLSRAESGVFALYMQGHTAREIAEIQHISINTVKTHNRHIYEKLNVSTYKELMVYIQMMDKKS